MTLQARFTQQAVQRFTINASSQNTNHGTVTGGGTFDHNQSVTLRATPNTGFAFDGWFEGNTRVSSNATWTFNATRNMTVQAIFDPLPTPPPTPAQTPTPTPPPPTPSPTRHPPTPITLGDNNSSAWARAELTRAANRGLIPPSLQNADLRLPITRGEFAGVVVRTFEQLANTTVQPAPANRFNDTQDPYVRRAYTAGLMVGTGSDIFSPNMMLNRETAATALARTFRRWANPGSTFATDYRNPLNFAWPSLFADDANISGWARESVYFMAANGIILGTGNNRFSPQATTAAQRAVGYAQATREAAIIMALRMAETFAD